MWSEAHDKLLREAQLNAVFWVISVVMKDQWVFEWDFLTSETESQKLGFHFGSV